MTDTEFHCPGGASFYGHYFACWHQTGSRQHLSAPGDSRNPATFLSTTWQPPGYRPASPTTPRWRASGTRPVSILPNETREHHAVHQMEDAHCPARSGMQVKPFRWRSDKAPSLFRRCNWQQRSAAWARAVTGIKPHLVASTKRRILLNQGNFNPENRGASHRPACMRL